MHNTNPLRALASAMNVLFILSRSCRRTAPTQRHLLSLRHAQRPQTSSFSTSPSLLKRATGIKSDPRVRMIRYYLAHPRLPRTLRFSRLRALRHWTIHRAAQLKRIKDRVGRERELERSYNSMRAAMEELRVGLGDGGRLYRQAMDRRGIFGGPVVERMRPGMNGGVPVEYAKAQTEGPSKSGWDSEWNET